MAIAPGNPIISRRISDEGHHDGQEGRGEPSQFGNGPAGEKAETAEHKDDFVGSTGWSAMLKCRIEIVLQVYQGNVVVCGCRAWLYNLARKTINAAKSCVVSSPEGSCRPQIRLNSSLNS